LAIDSEACVKDTTDWGFPKGKVAKTLRKILYPELTGHEVEAIVVCLMAHLLLENKLNGLLYQWLKQDAPQLNEDKMQSKAEGGLWKNIVEMGFAKKYSLVKPFFAAHFPKEAENVKKINTLRNTIFHGKAIRDAKFDGQPISEEKTVERIFLAAQSASMQFDEFEEWVDGPHACAERWSKRLEELGEPLF
jgi:hypothetical protein